MYNRKRKTQVTIEEPYENISSLRQTALSSKELLEVIAGQRGSVLDAAVTWGDLLDLGLIKKDQLPGNVGSGRG